MALFRQIDILDWWLQNARSGFGSFDRGAKTILAQQFGVSRSTISHDVAVIVERWKQVPCPTCRSPLDLTRREQLEKEGKVSGHRGDRASNNE